MTVNRNSPQITMDLYETDSFRLQEFITNEKAEKFSEEYLVLYNFASDCKYSEHIQPDLINYLLPFYLKAVEQAVLYKDKTAMEIYFEFNQVIFLNKKVFRYAVGENIFQQIMDYYLKQTIGSMGMLSPSILEWVSIFNTTVAFCDENIRKLFRWISGSPLEIKYSFFRYLSVLLFKESDNLFAVNETKEFWSSDIWDFDDGYSVRKFFWSDHSVEYFDKEIDRERIAILFNEIRPILCDIFEPEIINLFHEEMNRSFDIGVFGNRKAEFLAKIKNASNEFTYWDTTF